MIELKTCKYKGVEFLFNSMPTNGGNRLVKFNYPGSNKQSIEVQGRIPRSFTIVAIIPHDGYFEKRDDLIRVLEDGEKGVLTHPTWGDIENIINGEYSLNESITALGHAEITIQFEVDDAIGIPQKSENLVAEVAEETDALEEQLGFDLLDGFEISFPENFLDSFDILTGIADAFMAVSQFVDSIVSQVSGFVDTVMTFKANIVTFINDPFGIVSGIGSLASGVFGLFGSLVNLFDLPGKVFRSLLGLFDFGDDDPEIKTNTVSRVERKKNREILRTTIRSQALGVAYLEGVQIEFETTDDLETVQTILEDQYVDIRDNQLTTNEALEQLDRVRVQAQKTFDNVALTTRKIINVVTKRKPLSVFAYEYYGSTGNVDVIAKLNDIKQNGFVEGDLRIPTA